MFAELGIIFSTIAEARRTPKLTREEFEQRRLGRFRKLVRHANASAVKISMRQTTRNTSLTIADNGRGINPKALADPVSIGLIGMRERAQLIGAKLSISARPGKGTAVVVTVPASAARGRE